MQPASGKGPIPLGSSQGQSQSAGGLRHGQTREITQLHELSRQCIGLLEARQRLIQVQQIVTRLRGDEGHFVNVEPLATTAMFAAFLVASILDQDAPHRFSGGCKEVPAAVPALLGIGTHQAEIRLMDQGGGLKCLSRLLIALRPYGSLLHALGSGQHFLRTVREAIYLASLGRALIIFIKS